MEKLLLIPLMAFFGRVCGASWQPKKYPAEWVWAFVIALAAQPLTISHLIILTIWGFIAMQLGHGRFFAMQGANLADPKPEQIETFIQKVYKGDITKPVYSWLCMGAKGFLIALPLGFSAAVANALLWPLAYYIGFRKLNDGAYAEVLAGGFLGSLIWASLWHG